MRPKNGAVVAMRMAVRMYRWLNWRLVQQSDTFNKTASQDGEFRIALKPGEERVVTYRVCYDWN